MFLPEEEGVEVGVEDEAEEGVEAVVGAAEEHRFYDKVVLSHNL